ncbi:MAG TPA: hypothetical protein VGQ37_17860 [Vicinamibacterales bacterium]|nr:hypothetical protein [Vicinamibacterales bacterium]
MKQPVLGLVATAIGIVLALAFISLFSLPAFNGPVALHLLCAIPFQVMAVVIWGANPSFVAKLSQPGKGLSLLVLNLVAMAIITPLALMVVGEGIEPPGPVPSHFAIIVVPTTFWLAIVWGGWPFNLFGKNPVVAGLALLIGAYVLTWIGFRLFFNYDFLQGAPPAVNLASAPHGMFNGVVALVFYVTALAAMFLVLCFDLWPLTLAPAVMQQPALGITWSIVCVAIAWVATSIGFTVMGTDPMVFLTRVTVPFIFGSIVVLNMFQNSLVKAAQPLKGIVNTVLVIAIGQVLALLYRLAAPAVTGQLVLGPPAYDFEIWLANALLSVTFPFLIFIAAYFAYWPLQRDK